MDVRRRGNEQVVEAVTWEAVGVAIAAIVALGAFVARDSKVASAIGRIDESLRHLVAAQERADVRDDEFRKAISAQERVTDIMATRIDNHERRITDLESK